MLQEKTQLQRKTQSASESRGRGGRGRPGRSAPAASRQWVLLTESAIERAWMSVGERKLFSRSFAEIKCVGNGDIIFTTGAQS